MSEEEDAVSEEEEAVVEEYYIRQPDSEDTRGPFDMEKLSSLVEVEQVTRETLFYDDEKEEWIAFGDNKELASRVFPEKRQLILKAKSDEDMDLLNAAEDEIEAISVTDMLAAAEGDTDETRHLKEAAKWQEKAAALSMPVLGFIMLISAFNNVFPNYSVIMDVVDDQNYLALLQKPLLLVGFADLFLAIFLFLSVSDIFPMVRFRAMLGLGFFGFFHWGQWQTGDETSMILMAAGIMGSLGVFVCTLTLKMTLMILFGGMGLVGMGGYGYYALFQ